MGDAVKSCTFDVQTARFRRHTLTVFEVVNGWDVSCICHQWRHLDEDSEHWCEGEGIWRVWVDFAVEDSGADAPPEEYCSSPFNFPPEWDPAEHLVGVIDMRPAMRRERDLIRATEQKEA